MILLTFARSAIGWWRGRGLTGFQAHETAWVETALARYFVASGAARVAVHTIYQAREGKPMYTWVTHGIERVTAPAIEPVTLTETKQFLRVEQTTEDNAIAQMITAAREAAEQYLGVSLITQSWKLTLIPKTGSNQVIATSGYQLSVDKRALEVATPLAGDRFEILYQAGYGAVTEAVPGLIRKGILQHVVAMYEMRSIEAALPARALNSYHPYKEMSL